MTEKEDQLPLFFIIAGEPSGDLLGARLMQSLRERTGGRVRFMGIGGDRMIAEGLRSLFSQHELTHFGIFEVLSHLPRLIFRIRQTIAAIRRLRPAALITIDSPDFCFNVAKALKGQGIPLIHYVAPTVWIWRPRRAKKIAKFLDHLLALLPFEPPYFTKENLPCTFVGHPIVESSADKGDTDRLRAKYHLHPTAPLLTILPGSRRSELSRLLPVYGAAMSELKKAVPDLQTVLPTLPHFVETIQEATKDWAIKPLIVVGDEDKYDAFAASTAALACSGTVTVELAMANLPSVVTYKVNPLSATIAQHLLLGRFTCLINIMHNRMIVPELLQNFCTPQSIAAELIPLLTSDYERAHQRRGLHQVAVWLGKGAMVPSQKAADMVLSIARK
jgi:lipid-A-disaccharide synthase